LCDLENIPKENNIYDLILCTQVLEHVKEPDTVLKEFHRVLKPTGTLLLTLPQAYHIHEEPNNYFNFTKFGIKYLLEKNNFIIKKIEQQSGWYFFLADEFRNANRKNIHIGIFLFPLSEIVFPILGLLLDKIEFTKKQTLGYNIVAVKKEKNYDHII